MTGMDLTRLQYFVAVAEAGSFSRAAAALHLPHPSLGRQLQLAEDELGQASWIDPDTGELAEGQSKPRIGD